MKIFLSLLLLVSSIKSYCTNYYFSTSGNDANVGTTNMSPFKTITKLNTLPLVAGDTVFFKSGEVFRGQITVSASGNALQPIVFAAYGVGNAPIISGAELVTGFTLNGSKYEKTLTQKTNNFFVSDKEQILARYPNTGRYLALDSAQKTYLKDAELASLPSNFINNSRICIHTAQWCWEKTNTANYNNAEKITYTTATNLAAIANYGYFLYDNINLLDTANEWKFDSTTMLLSYMPANGINPNSVTCEVAVYTDGMKLTGNASYITIMNLMFDKQMNAGISTASINNKYIYVDGCSFYRQYNYGFYDRGKYNQVANSFFRECDGFGILVTGTGAGNTVVHHNTFRNIGPYRNSGIGTEINLTAIKFAFVDSCHAHHNDIDSTGYCGISADGGYHIVEKNIIKNAMLLNNDGAALKSFAVASHHITYRNNFITSSDGNTEGTYNPNFSTPAIYFDFNVNNCLIQDNTIYGRNQKAIFQNAGNYNNSIIGNNIHGANYGIDLNGHPNANTADTINGYTIKRNSIFLRNSFEYIYRQVDFSNTFNYGLIDSNYYFQPYAANKFIQRIVGSSTTSVAYNSWQAAGFDAHSKVNNFMWATGVDSSQIFINPTDNIAPQNLGSWLWQDLDGNLVTSLTLQPWASKILIRTATLMPLTITNFNAALLNKELVTCNWETRNETNLSYFNIQKSSNEKNFTTIAREAAKNNSVNTYSYNYNCAALDCDGFYRIEAVDIDGKKNYSITKRISSSSTLPSIIVYPNPTYTYTIINSNDVLKEVKLFNANGKLLQVVKAVSTTQIINTSNLSKGIYILAAETKLGKKIIKKLIVL